MTWSFGIPPGSHAGTSPVSSIVLSLPSPLPNPPPLPPHEEKKHFTAAEIGGNEKCREITKQKFTVCIPENRARNPCVLLLMTSISWRVTVWTTSFLFCISPSGHWTNLVWNRKSQLNVTNNAYNNMILCNSVKPLITRYSWICLNKVSTMVWTVNKHWTTRKVAGNGHKVLKKTA